MGGGSADIAVVAADAVGVTSDGSAVSAVALGIKSILELPLELRERGSSIEKLDLSENDISSLDGLSMFPNLKTLVLDNNQLADCSGMTVLHKLETLWLNKNVIGDLDDLLGVLEAQCPKLQYLSLLGNAVCKNELVGSTKEESELYRLRTVNRLPCLRLLDSMPVTAAERKQVKERSSYLRVAKPSRASVKSAAQDEKQYYKDKGREGQHSTFLSFQQHNYTGKTSEGNRFIRDEML